MSTRIPIILYRHLLKRRYLIALTLVTLLVGSNARSQTNNWQNSVISSESLYSNIECDTIISRTYGSSLVVTCARVPNNYGRPSCHRIVVRCMNSNNYFNFDILHSWRDTMLYYIDKNYYYIRDMRMSDSICFFCGTKVIHRTYLSIPGNPYSVPIAEDTLSKGFVGRIEINAMLRDSNAVVWLPTINPDDPPGYPVPVTEWHPYTQITEINKTASLEKIWVDDGLHIEGTKNTEGEVDDPLYEDNSVYYDPDFSIENAQAYLIGRLNDNPDQTCLVIILNHLYLSNIQSDYSIFIPQNPSERLCDVKGTDGRIIFSSRIDSDIIRETYPFEYTLGVRYKDIVSNDDDYLSHLHMYAYYSHPSNVYWESNPMAHDEYGHICRLKNHCAYNSCDEEERNDDFCLVYSGSDYHGNYGSLHGITHIIHIDRNMDVDMAFYLGDRWSGDNGGKYPINDVVFLGGYDRNCIAISYILPFQNHFVDLVDWGYAGREALNQPLFNKSIRLQYPSRKTQSMDVFLAGETFLSGNILNATNVFELSTQNRGYIGGGNNLTCTYTSPITNRNKLDITHWVEDWGMLLFLERQASWIKIPTTAVKRSIESTCKKTNDK